MRAIGHKGTSTEEIREQGLDIYSIVGELLTNTQLAALATAGKTVLGINLDGLLCAVHSNGVIDILNEDKSLTDAEMFAMSNPKAGKTYWNTDRGKLVSWDGTQWVEVLVSELWTTIMSEDFESGALPSGMTVVNDGGGNDGFIVGSSCVYSGSYSFYGRRNAADNCDYNNSRTYHAYFDVAIPAGVSEWRLSGIFKCPSESGYDGATVHFCDTTVTPTSGNQLSDNGTSINKVGDTLYSAIAAFQHREIAGLSKYIGSTVRIVITFDSDGSIDSDDGNYATLVLDEIKIETKG